MVLKYHPSKSKAKGAENELNEIGEAYDILSSLESNWPPYDQFEEEGLKGLWVEVMSGEAMAFQMGLTGQRTWIAAQITLP